MKKLILLLLPFLFMTFAQAQVQKTLHQTFDISGADKIQVSLADNYEVQNWAGNNVMIEMTIKLSHVQQNVLDYVIHQEGRYNIQLLRPQENIVQLVSKNPSRKSISVKGVDAEEVVLVRIFVPDTYNIEDKNQFTLNDTTAVNSNK
jgi:hypothetical protein